MRFNFQIAFRKECKGVTVFRVRTSFLNTSCLFQSHYYSARCSYKRNPLYIRGTGALHRLPSQRFHTAWRRLHLVGGTFSSNLDPEYPSMILPVRLVQWSAVTVTPSVIGKSVTVTDCHSNSSSKLPIFEQNPSTFG